MSDPSRSNPSRSNQSPNWLNNTVKVGNNDVSMATVLLSVLGISFAFGTSWLTGIFSAIGLKTAIALVAVAFAYRLVVVERLGLAKIIMLLIAFVLTTYGLVWLISKQAPKMVSEIDVSGWQQLRSEYSAASPDLFGDGWLAGNDAPADTTYGIITATPDANFGGGVPAAASTPVPTLPPTPAGPTPTPDLVATMLPELNASVSAQNRVAARSVVDAMLRQEPSNQRALEVQRQLDHVDELLRLRKGMPVQPSTTIDPVKSGYISGILNGGQYRIIEDGQGFMQRACKSVATIKELNGWLAGETYRVQLCLLDQFNVGKTGDEFTVNVGG